MDEWYHPVSEWIVFGILYLFTGILPITLMLSMVYVAITMPMRRAERARLFLALIDHGMKRGRTPEQTVVEASDTQDSCLGKRFHRVAADIKLGLPLSAALERTPYFLPKRIVGCIKTGERIGGVSKTLAASRYLTSDSVSHVRGGLNYLVMLVFVVSPLAAYVPLVIRVKILPSYRQVFAGMFEGNTMPRFSRIVFDNSTLLTCLQLGIIAALWLLALSYILGPRWNWLSAQKQDWLSWNLPWRRKRLCRDFSTLLAILLDSQVPEAEAVCLAAESVGNRELQKRANGVGHALQEGVALPEALSQMDDRGELRWRIANALRGRDGFLRALAGWHESLDAKAFQQEQAAAQIVSTSLVLFNGFIVACFVTGIFWALVHVINSATLW